MEQSFSSDDIKETVREHSDLLSVVSEYLSLKKTGQNYTGLCPFHDEKTASFSVNPGKQFYHCFGCGVGGDVFKFVSDIESISFSDALEKLAHRAGITLPEAGAREGQRDRSEVEQIFQANEAALSYFQTNLKTSGGAQALNYLHGRGLSEETIESFQLGWSSAAWDGLIKALKGRFSLVLLAKAGLTTSKEATRAGEAPHYYDRFRQRVIFPIKNAQGRVAGFGGRVLGEGLPKYLNTSETPVFSKGKILYGQERSRHRGDDPVIVVEGYLDVISGAQAGIPNLVATMGTALTEAHLRLISRIAERVVLVFDGDAAGNRAALRVAPMFVQSAMSAKIATLPQGQDPDVFVRTEGASAFLEKIKDAAGIIDFAMDCYLRQYAPQSVEEKSKVLGLILPLLQKLGSEVEKSHYLSVLSQRLGLKETALRADYLRLGKTSKQRSFRPELPRKEVGLPVSPEERDLLLLLVQDHLDPESLNGKLSLSDFRHPVVLKILSDYWDEESEMWQPAKRSAADLDSDCRSLLSRLFGSELLSFEDLKQTEGDVIKVFQKKKLDLERRRIETQIKQLDRLGERNGLNLLQKRIIDLAKASSQLS